MTAAASGPAAHFAAMYRELVRFIARRTGNDDDARDLAHDTWLRLAEHQQAQDARAADPPDNPRAYVFTVAHHLALDHLRRRKLAGSLALAPAAAAAPDVADAVMYGQAVQAVEAALLALPDRAREVFLQHRLQGIGQAELAQRHQLSRNMIERDVMLAMDQVQAAIERWHGSAGTAARRGRRRSLSALLGLAGLAGTGLGAWQAAREWLPSWQMSLASRRGQQLHQALPDGSEVTLDAHSRAELQFFAHRRQVQLQAGAAFFSVVRDAARPFVVDAGAARITVLGTRFGVDLNGGETQIQVESGRVQVQVLDTRGQPGAPVLLHDGQMLRVAAPARSATGSHADAQPVPAPAGLAAPWRTGTLVFDATPLRDAIQRLDRYGGVPVSLDARVAKLPVSGQVRITLAQDWLQALPSVLPVRVERRAVQVDGQGVAGWHIAAR